MPLPTSVIGDADVIREYSAIAYSCNELGQVVAEREATCEFFYFTLLQDERGLHSQKMFAMIGALLVPCIALSCCLRLLGDSNLFEVIQMAERLYSVISNRGRTCRRLFSVS